MSLSARSNRILLIDDNQEIHDDFRKVLLSDQDNLAILKEAVFGQAVKPIEIPSYEIDSVYQGEDGYHRVQQAQKEKKPYFLAFIDIRMPPGWDGIETIEKIWQVDPDIQTVICTAYSDYAWQEMIKKLGWSDRLLILKKPFDSIEVRQLACALAEKWNLLRQSRNQIDFMQTMVDERTAEIRATLEATTDGIVVVSHDSKIIDYNQNFIELWKNLTWKEKGIEPLLAHKDPTELISFIAANLVDAPPVTPLLEKLVHSFEEESFIEAKMELHLKNEKIIELYTHPLRHNESIIGKVLSFRDVTEARYFEKQLTFQATHDLLTHLPNRVLLSDRLEQAIFQARRSKTKIAVLFLDLDRFKLVNDSLGHSFGDELLKMVAQKLEYCKRESDTLCRVGGDEFVLIMPGLRDENQSLMAIKKIQNILKQPMTIQGNLLSLTCSLGISFYPKNGSNAEELLKNADAAMYRAKALGKNTFQFYAEEMNAHMKERLEMEQNLYLAYKLGELLLHYQPIVNAQTGVISGSEALLRWQHPQIGLIAPKKFISIAEETGLILPIGEWVLRTACEQNLRWQRQGLPFLPISINLSGYQVKNIDSIYTVSKVLDELQYDGNYLELELTENILMSSTSEVKEAFRHLREKNVSFVIDDFGTGYSNLNYLLHYPITKLKLDKNFVENVARDPIELTIIEAIVTMAHSLKIKVVAEGVESRDQAELLKKCNCDEMQGFYFSKPLDTESYTKLLQEGISLAPAH